VHKNFLYIITLSLSLSLSLKFVSPNCVIFYSIELKCEAALSFTSRQPVHLHRLVSFIPFFLSLSIFQFFINIFLVNTKVFLMTSFSVSNYFLVSL
jgi:hypothetical protein